MLLKIEQNKGHSEREFRVSLSSSGWRHTPVVRLLAWLQESRGVPRPGGVSPAISQPWGRDGTPRGGREGKPRHRPVSCRKRSQPQCHRQCMIIQEISSEKILWISPSFLIEYFCRGTFGIYCGTSNPWYSDVLQNRKSSLNNVLI